MHIVKRKPSNTFPWWVTLDGKRWSFAGGYPHGEPNKASIERDRKKARAKYVRLVEFHDVFKDGGVRKSWATYYRR